MAQRVARPEHAQNQVGESLLQPVEYDALHAADVRRRVERRPYRLGKRGHQPLRQDDGGRYETQRDVARRRQVPGRDHARQRAENHGCVRTQIRIRKGQGFQHRRTLHALERSHGHALVPFRRHDHRPQGEPHGHLYAHHPALRQLRHRPGTQRRPSPERHGRRRGLLQTLRGHLRLPRPVQDQLLPLSVDGLHRADGGRREQLALRKRLRLGVRPRELQLQIEILRPGELPLRRLGTLQERQPLGILPLGVGRLGPHAGEIHGGGAQRTLVPQAARILRTAGQRPHRQLPLPIDPFVERPGGFRRLLKSGTGPARVLGLSDGSRRHHLGDHRNL